MSRWIWVVLAYAVAGRTAVAQLEPLALHLPASTRAASMGNIAITGREDDVLFYSPSQLVIGRGTSITVTRQNPLVRGGGMSTVARLGSGGIGFGVNYLEFQTHSPFACTLECAARTPTTRDNLLEDAPCCTTMAASTMVASVGAAQLRGRYRIGATVNYAAEVAASRRRAVALSAGVSRELSRYFTLAIVGRNIGPSVGHDSDPRTPLPWEVAAGGSGSGPVGPLDVVLSTEVAYRRNDFVAAAMGTELEYSWLSGYSVDVRGGFRRRQAGEAQTTLGAGFNMDRFSFDYGLEYLRHAQVHHLGMRIR